MGKVAAKNANFSLGAVALEGFITSISQEVTVETPAVTCLSDAGPRRVEGNYDFGYPLEGNADFAGAAVDATLFGRIGNGGAATAFDPTGATAGADDPNYDATSVLLSNYTIRAQVGGAVTYTARLDGNSALERNVS